MKELFVVSTLYQCVSLAAAIDSGAIPPAQGERILVLNHNAIIPEVSTPFFETPGWEEVSSHFDRTVNLSDLVWPRRTGQFNPRGEELYMWEKLLRSEWNLGRERLHLYVESIQVNPALALCRVFASALISVHSDGLMSYGPTRTAISREMSQRLDSLIYVDLVPGLVPQLLRENNPRLVPVDGAALRRRMEELAAVLPSDETAVAAISGTPEAQSHKHGLQHGATARGSALVLGQYLSELSILSTEEEIELHRAMLQKALDRGIQHCVFKPHPSAGPGAVTSIQLAAIELGLELQVLTSTSPAEVVMQRLQPKLVVSCFSTALMTAKYLFGIEAVAVGTDILLERLAPYQNSNRIPVTIIDALLERDFVAPNEPGAAKATDSAALPNNSLQQLVETVSYCMQPEMMVEGRNTALAFLGDIEQTDHMRYFKRRRLSKLELPGALPVRVPDPRKAALRRAHRAGLRLVRRFKIVQAK